MKQIFAALNLDDGPSSLPSNEEEVKGAASEVAQMNPEENQAYGFDDGQQFGYKSQW
jgi:hypothetical protein